MEMRNSTYCMLMARTSKRAQYTVFCNVAYVSIHVFALSAREVFVNFVHWTVVGAFVDPYRFVCVWYTACVGIQLLVFWSHLLALVVAHILSLVLLDACYTIGFGIECKRNATNTSTIDSLTHTHTHT